MNPFKLAIALPLALAATAVPALAHNDAGYGNQPGWAYRGDRGQVNGLRQQLFQLDRQIDRGQEMRRLNQREAWGLRSDLKQIDRELAFAMRGGLNRFEMGNLQHKIDFLRLKLDRQMHDYDAHGRGFDNRSYDNRGYDNRGYDNRGYDNRGPAGPAPIPAPRGH